MALNLPLPPNDPFYETLRELGYEEDYLSNMFPISPPGNEEQARLRMMWARNIMKSILDDTAAESVSNRVWRRSSKRRFEYSRTGRAQVTYSMVGMYATVYPSFHTLEGVFVKRHVLQIAILLLRSMRRRNWMTWRVLNDPGMRELESTLQSTYMHIDQEYQSFLNSMPTGNRFRPSRT